MSRSPLTEHMPAGRPAAELDVDAALITSLLKAQHPDLARLPLSHLDSGWDNVIYRLGDRYTVRVPRREMAAQLLINEQVWLPRLAGELNIPVPTPVRLGNPTTNYPWHWSVLPWFEGQAADMAPPADREAGRFADFLKALHQPAPADAPDNPVRGVPLQVREPNTQERLDRLREQSDLITSEILEIWEAGLAAPRFSQACWLHGDLHAQNVLTNEDGTISAVIDWGDITSGDTATDLGGIWALFDSSAARQHIIESYGPDPATLARARGWAAMFGIILVDSGMINSPRHAAAGERTLRRLAEDAGQ